MKLFRKEKKPAGAYCCPICKRVYRHAGMAERCTRTAVCRLYNTPPAEVRETWRLVGGAASLGWFLAHPVLGTEPEDSGLYGAARAVQDTTGELFAALHKVFPCADHVRRALHAALMGEVAGIWPPGHPAHLGHVGDVIRSVICDARGEAVARAVRPGLLDGMRELEERVEALYGEIIPEGEADYEEDAIDGHRAPERCRHRPEARRPQAVALPRQRAAPRRRAGQGGRAPGHDGVRALEAPHPGHQPRREVRGRAHRRGHHQDSRARPGAHRTHGGVSMSQSHEKQLVEALRGILATGDDRTSLERDEKILKAIKEELAPLVELAATRTGNIWMRRRRLCIAAFPFSRFKRSVTTVMVRSTSRTAPRSCMPARILSDIWSRGRSRLVIDSCLFNEFEGFPFGVGAEFRVPLRRTGVLWPTSVPMVYRGTFLLASQEQNVWRSVWKTTLYRLSVMPSFRPRIDTALAKVLLREVG